MNTRRLIQQRPDLLTESELSGLVVEVARLGGWTLRYHTFTSRRSAHGFPDWVLVHPEKRRVVFAELKTQVGKLTAEQKQWQIGLLAAGVEAYVWKPSDWPQIVETLTGKRPVTPTPAPERNTAA